MSIIHKALQKLQREKKENTTQQSVPFSLAPETSSLVTSSKKLRHIKIIGIITGSVVMVLGSFAVYVTQFQSAQKNPSAVIDTQAVQKNDSATLSTEGIEAYKKGDFPKSVELFQKALEKNDTDSFLYNNIGLAYLKQNDTTNAQIHFEKAISLNKECFECYNNLGLVKVKLEKFNEAHTHFNDALKINKNYADAYFNQGVLFEREENYEEAVNNYTQFIFLSPKEHQAILEKVNQRIEMLLNH